MSEYSAHDSVSSSKKRSATLATTVSDNDSVASSRIVPRAPHPTPANTVAGDLPSMNYILDRTSGMNFEETPIGIRSSGASATALSTISSHTTDDASVEYPEANIWAQFATEDVENALKRLAMLAKDENQLDPRKSVKAYYSERLAKILKDAEIEFDVKFMK